MIDYREDNKWTVYIHIVPKEISNYDWDKYYVGITSQSVKRRWGNNGCNYKNTYFHNAISKYNWNNILHEIIAENLTHNEACDMEKALIKELNSNDKIHGYNIFCGGDGGNQSGVIPVKQYDLKGNFIRSYDSAADAANELGFHRTHITRCCKHSGSTHAYMFCYANEAINAPYRRKTQRDIIQTTLDGEYIAEYISLTDAMEQTGIGHDNILRCIKKKNRYAGGYLWFYKDEYEKQEVIQTSFFID